MDWILWDKYEKKKKKQRQNDRSLRVNTHIYTQRIWAATPANEIHTTEQTTGLSEKEHISNKHKIYHTVSTVFAPCQFQVMSDQWSKHTKKAVQQQNKTYKIQIEWVQLNFTLVRKNNRQLRIDIRDHCWRTVCVFFLA